MGEKKKNIMEEEEVAHTYRCMAETCRNMGNLSLSKQYNQISLKIFISVCGKDQLIVALILSSIASLYLEENNANDEKNFIFSENYQQVLECLNESIRIRKLHYSTNKKKDNNWKNIGYDLAHNL